MKNSNKINEVFKEIENDEIELYLAEFETSSYNKPLDYDAQKKKTLELINQKREENPVYITKKSFKNILKASLLVAILAVLLAVTAFAAHEVYEIYHISENQVDTDLQFSPDGRTKSDLFGKYSFLPDGYSKVSQKRSIWYKTERLVYQDGDGNLIVCQSGLISDGGIVSVNTENGNLMDIELTLRDGSNAYGKYALIDYGDEENVTLVWVTGNTWHSITAHNLSITTVKKMAESRS